MSNAHFRKNPRMAAARKVRLANLTDEDREQLKSELLDETMAAASKDASSANAKLLTTASDVSSMTPEEINAQWGTVSKVLSDPNAWQEEADDKEEPPATTELASLQKKLASMSPEQANDYINSNWEFGANIIGTLGRAVS